MVFGVVDLHFFKIFKKNIEGLTLGRLLRVLRVIGLTLLRVRVVETETCRGIRDGHM